MTHINATDFEQVEGVKRVANGFAVDQAVHRQVADGFSDGLWQGDDEPAAVDSLDLSALLAYEHPFAVMLLLENMTGVTKQPGQLAFMDRIEKLAANAAVASLDTRGVVRRAVLRRGIALGQFGGDELCCNAFSLLTADGFAGFGAGLERGSAPAIGEGHMIAVSGWFDVGMIDFSGVPFAVVQGCGHGLFEVVGSGFRRRERRESCWKVKGPPRGDAERPMVGGKEEGERCPPFMPSHAKP